MALAYWSIKNWSNRNELVLICTYAHFTTGTAVRTRGSCPLFGDPTLENGFVFERSRRTGINARAATHTRTRCQGSAGVGNNPSLMSPVKDLPDKLTLKFFANSHTAITKNALGHVNMNVGVRRIEKLRVVTAVKVRLDQTVLRSKPVEVLVGKPKKCVRGMI